MRVSNLGIKQNLQFNIRNNYTKMQKAQNQMVTGQRHKRASDNPIAAINSVYYRVRSNRLDQYIDNVNDSKGYIDIQHNKISHITDLLQKSREMAVQGANGIYTADDRKNMAMEINEYLEEMVATANSQHMDNFIFAGAKTDKRPFRSFEKSYDGLSKPMIERVEYLGNDINQKRDVDINDEVEVTLSGSRVFWGDTHMVVSTRDARGYVVASNQVIRIDGESVDITAGDNLDTIIQKINNNVPSVRAFKQELPNGNVTFAVESSFPHKMHIEDLEGGTVMQDLGILRTGERARIAGNNIHPDTIQSGGSLFDIMIRFRNSLINNNPEDIGGRDLASISMALGSLLESQAKISAVQNRLNFVENKLHKDKEFTTERLSKNEDMDMAEASINFNQLANVHHISLMTATKMIQPTLMDYLR